MTTTALGSFMTGPGALLGLLATVVGLGIAVSQCSSAKADAARQEKIASQQRSLAESHKDVADQQLVALRKIEAALSKGDPSARQEALEEAGKSVPLAKEIAQATRPALTMDRVRQILRAADPARTNRDIQRALAEIEGGEQPSITPATRFSPPAPVANEQVKLFIDDARIEGTTVTALMRIHSLQKQETVYLFGPGIRGTSLAPEIGPLCDNGSLAVGSNVQSSGGAMPWQLQKGVDLPFAVTFKDVPAETQTAKAITVVVEIDLVKVPFTFSDVHLRR